MELGGEKMLKKLYRTLGFALISCNLFFTPVMAYADSSVSVGTNMCFAIPGGLITGFCACFNEPHKTESYQGR